MKFSKAMLRGYEKVGGKQFRGSYLPAGQAPNAPTRVCVMGAVNLGTYGHVGGAAGWKFARKFFAAWGITPFDLNDEGMPWEHIYGMAVAAGQ